MSSISNISQTIFMNHPNSWHFLSVNKLTKQYGIPGGQWLAIMFHYSLPVDILFKSGTYSVCDKRKSSRVQKLKSV